MRPRFADLDMDLFGTMADRLRAAADELRTAGKTRRRNKAMATRLETYASAIENDLQGAAGDWPVTSPRRKAGS